MEKENTTVNEAGDQSDPGVAATGTAVTDKLLAMHNTLDDGYGSSNSSPHSGGKC